MPHVERGETVRTNRTLTGYLPAEQDDTLTDVMITRGTLLTIAAPAPTVGQGWVHVDTEHGWTAIVRLSALSNRCELIG